MLLWWKGMTRFSALVGAVLVAFITVVYTEVKESWTPRSKLTSEWRTSLASTATLVAEPPSLL